MTSILLLNSALLHQLQTSNTALFFLKTVAKLFLTVHSKYKRMKSNEPKQSSTIIFLRHNMLDQSCGRKRLCAPFCGSTRNSPIGTVPEHHSKTPLRWENGTTWYKHPVINLKEFHCKNYYPVYLTIHC